jgi:hypothetical protein
MMNLLDVLNNILITSCINYSVDNLFMCSKYFVGCRAKVDELLSHDVLWYSKVLTVLLTNTTTSRSHSTTLFDLAIRLFQSKTHLIVGVIKKSPENN